MLSLRTLGRLSLEDGPKTVLSGRRKALAFLAYLLRQGGRPLGRDELASMFWPTADEGRARQSLRTMLTELRGAVGDLLEVDAEHVRIAQGAIELDASLIEAEVARGHFKSAVGRWSGEFLDGLEDVGDDRWRFWLETERTGLRTQLAFALERLSAEAETSGQWPEAVEYAEQWARLVPSDERAATRVVQSLRAAGRESEAIARHAALSRVVEEHSGATPSATFVRLVRGRLEERGTPGVRGLLTPDLVGRESALSTLTRAWSEASRGPGRCVLVEGDEGLGRTRLLEEFARFLRTARAEAVVVVARAFASERSRSFAALRAMLDPLAEVPGLSAMPPALLASLGEVSPAIADRFPGGASRGHVDEAFTRLIGEVAYESPLALLIDDAPLADANSLDAIVRLALRPPERVLLVLSGTPDAWHRAGASDELRRAAHVSRVHLGPLDVDQTRRFAESVLPLEPHVGEALATRLHAETGGRPALLQLAIRQLVESGALTPGPTGRWTLANTPGELSFSVHSAVSDQLRHRIAGLEAASRRVLEAAAVVGPRVDPALLERVAGVTADQYLAATTDLLARRLLRTSPAADGPIEFIGEAERRAVYDAIAPSTRRAYHRAAGRALRASSDSDRNRSEIAEHRRLGGADPRRRAAIGAGVTLGALAIGVTTPLAFRAPAGVPSGTPVLLASVQNLTSDSTLGSALDLAARIGLQQSRHISVIPVSQVNDALARMRRTPTPAGIDELLARDIAQRENVAALVRLGIARIDSAYLVTGRVIDPSVTRDRFATSVSARGAGSILSSLDEVLKRVRTALGESRFAVRRPAQSLPRVTTSSLDALRAYARGTARWVRGYYPEAKVQWLEAVSLDPAFALAYASLGDFYYYRGDSGIDRVAGDRYLDLALAHADRLTEREDLALRALIARYRGSAESAREHTRRLAERYPDRDSWYNLGSLLMRQGRSKEGISALREALANDSMFANAWINLAGIYQLSGFIDSALDAYSRAARIDTIRFRRGGNVNQEWGMALLRAGRESAAESLYRTAAQVGAPLLRAGGQRSLAWLEMYRGRYGEAARLLDEAARIGEAERSVLSSARNRWILASVLLDRGDRRAAIMQLDRAESLLNSLAVTPSLVFYLGHLRLRTGDATGARRLLHGLEKTVHRENVADRDALEMLGAWISLHDGRPDSAVAVARRCACDAFTLLGYRDALLSQAYERMAQVDSALAAAKRVEELWQFGWEAQPAWRHAGLRVARLALAAGDTAQAKAALARQLERWKGADTEFPDLREARHLAVSLSVNR
jgi:DNA-binding SARP family transcriptional activator